MIEFVRPDLLEYSILRKVKRMPRKDDSQQTQRQNPPDSRRRPPGDLRGPAGDGIEAAPDTWLDNPRNVQSFFDAIERARSAKGRGRPS
jgi:hypothetical protein